MKRRSALDRHAAFVRRLGQQRLAGERSDQASIHMLLLQLLNERMSAVLCLSKKPHSNSPLLLL